MDPIFIEGVTTPMRLTRINEVFHPSVGENHSHWFYEFEPDMEQGALLAQQREAMPDEDVGFGMVMAGEQRAVYGPFRVGCRRPSFDLCVGDLYDVILVRRDPIPVPELSENGLQRLMRHLFDPSEAEDGHLSKVLTIVPLVDLEAAEYDAPPDIDGLPDLTHIDTIDWESMTTVQRLNVIAQARQEQR